MSNAYPPLRPAKSKEQHVAEMRAWLAKADAILEAKTGKTKAQRAAERAESAAFHFAQITR